jgi:hypothetical protein
MIKQYNDLGSILAVTSGERWAGFGGIPFSAAEL